MMGMYSCTKTEYVPDPQLSSRTYVREIVANNWKRESNALIYCDIPLNDLKDYYILQGSVSVALSFDDEVSYEVLPATIDAVSYSINYTTGFVTIYADDPLSDDGVVTPIPASVIVKIVLSDSEFID